MAALKLGFIRRRDRTPAQWAAHIQAVGRMARFALVPPTHTGPTKVCLFDAWSSSKVVQDVGFVFPRFHQLTGSCVGAGGGQALFTLIAVQRCLATDPTRAFVPFWPFDYGRCRTNEGDRGEGEGALGSSFADTIVKEGVIAAAGPNADPNLPAFQNDDGLVLTERLEMQWSDGAARLVTAHLTSAKQHPVGSAAEMKSTDDIKAAILNGYPVTFACDNYIGHGQLQGSGPDQIVMAPAGWDGNGGHQQSIHGYWDHPQYGPIFHVQNNWPASSYPTVPTQPVCSTWVPEPKVADALANLDAEVYALSHLAWFPAQPDVIDPSLFA